MNSTYSQILDDADADANANMIDLQIVCLMFVLVENEVNQVNKNIKSMK